MPKPVIDPNGSYTFRSYFELNPPIDELLAYFGYTRQTELCNLPKLVLNEEPIQAMQRQLEAYLRITDLTSETAKREVLVAPVLLHVGVYLQTRLYIEYPLQVNDQLKGKIDYYLRHKGNLLIVEAKNDDLGRGFTQLTTELIALDQWLEMNDKPLYGAVTIGNVWQFAVLERQSKLITQDINLYRIPADLLELLQIVIAILDG